MLNLAKLPLLPLSAMTDAARVRIESELRLGLRQDGASSYKAGIARGDSPPFVDPDMTSHWRSGWYDEHSRHFHSADRKHARKRCTADCRHNEDARPWLSLR